MVWSLIVVPCVSSTAASNPSLLVKTRLPLGAQSPLISACRCRSACTNLLPRACPDRSRVWCQHKGRARLGAPNWYANPTKALFKVAPSARRGPLRKQGFFTSSGSGFPKSPQGQVTCRTDLNQPALVVGVDHAWVGLGLVDLSVAVEVLVQAIDQAVTVRVLLQRVRLTGQLARSRRVVARYGFVLEPVHPSASES